MHHIFFYIILGIILVVAVLVVCNALHLTPRSMAKLGQLYLNNGYWNGE